MNTRCSAARWPRHQRRKDQQRQPAQGVVGAEQEPRVDRSVSQPDAIVPTTSNRPTSASSPAAVVSGMPWSWAAGMKWVAISPLVVTPQIANPPDEQPERARAGGDAEYAERAAGVRPDLRCGGGPGHLGLAVRREAHIGRVVPQEQQHERNDGQRGAGRDEGRRAPAVVSPARRPGQEDQLAGGAGGGEDAGDQAAVLDEPPAGDGRDERQRHRSGAESDQDTPAAGPAARLVMNTVSPLPAATRQQREGDHPPDAEAVHQRRGERRHQAEEQQVDRDRGPIRPRDQPNSSSSGAISTPGAARNPAAPMSATNATPATSHARWILRLMGASRYAGRVVVVT